MIEIDIAGFLARDWNCHHDTTVTAPAPGMLVVVDLHHELVKQEALTCLTLLFGLHE